MEELEGSPLRKSILGVFLSTGGSLERWYSLGIFDREISLYNKLSRYIKRIYFISYGDFNDLRFKKHLANNIEIVYRRHFPGYFHLLLLLYSLLLPFINKNILKKIDIIKTNQMSGSWSALIAKFLYKNTLIVRTGYIWSIFFHKKHKYQNNKYKKIAYKLITKLVETIERIAYRYSDGVITSSREDYLYIQKKYCPKAVHYIIPNYIETDIFKPIKLKKKEGSLCFIGRLDPQKNLYSLLMALKGLPYTLTIIGSGPQEIPLRELAKKERIKVKFLGRVPNHKLPEIINQHEVFILPSFFEGMPKALLEAMSCGVAVIGTNVEGNKEVIINGKNGILCKTDSNSIREAIINLIENKKLQRKLGKHARETILREYSLEVIVKKELKLYMEILMKKYSKE